MAQRQPFNPLVWIMVWMVVILTAVNLDNVSKAIFNSKVDRGGSGMNDAISW